MILYYNTVIKRYLDNEKQSNKEMAQLLFLPAFKFSIDLFCFFTVGITFFNKLFQIHLYEYLNLTVPQNNIVLNLSVLFLVIRIIWFLYEKLWLDRKERKERKNIEKKIIQETIENLINKIKNK
jgi:hypothetical protein